MGGAGGNLWGGRWIVSLSFGSLEDEKAFIHFLFVQHEIRMLNGSETGT